MDCSLLLSPVLLAATYTVHRQLQHALQTVPGPSARLLCRHAMHRRHTTDCCCGAPRGKRCWLECRPGVHATMPWHDQSSGCHRCCTGMRCAGVPAMRPACSYLLELSCSLLCRHVVHWRPHHHGQAERGGLPARPCATQHHPGIGARHCGPGQAGGGLRR